MQLYNGHVAWKTILVILLTFFLGVSFSILAIKSSQFSLPLSRQSPSATPLLHDLYPTSMDLQISPPVSSSVPLDSGQAGQTGVFIPQLEKVKITRVIDGDTIETETGRRIRYIGIDTPESTDPRKMVECFAKEAAFKNRELVLNKEVYLEKDVSEVDKYGRLLRYVWVILPSDEQIMVNEVLVKEGYALAVTYPPDIKYQQLFLQAERQAREEGKGLWSSCPAKRPPESSEVVTGEVNS